MELARPGPPPIFHPTTRLDCYGSEKLRENKYSVSSFRAFLLLIILYRIFLSSHCCRYEIKIEKSLPSAQVIVLAVFDTGATQTGLRRRASVAPSISSRRGTRLLDFYFFKCLICALPELFGGMSGTNFQISVSNCDRLSRNNFATTRCDRNYAI